MSKIEDLARQVAAQLVKQTAQDAKQSSQDGSDHDLIQRLDVKMDIVTKKVDDLTTNVVGRIEKLELLVTQQAELIKDLIKTATDRETRLRILEQWVWKAIGAIGVATALVGFIDYFKK